ncbi:hypothetical protein SCHPADRAFT_900868 [Schizopora paradoxa]|uniref:Uncharacterized protein n=1 Tax=Schizopora paradoxa TaxID=27342 RepID=A0A0H2S6E4_9AGAM|nr:hypothetical protein SCHPADRAFT_900868 [Schizopora paradoxa]
MLDIVPTAPLSPTDDPHYHEECTSPVTQHMRARREQRYSREETALTKSLAESVAEPSPQELQLRTLQRAKDLLSVSATEAGERLANVRLRLAEDDARDQENREDLLRQRWVEEQRLAAVNREISAIIDQMEGLKSHQMQQDITAEKKDVLRMSANFDLFLQKSPTKRPLHSHPRRPHSIISLPMEASSSRPVRNSASVSVRSKPPRFHARSRSLVEEKELGKLHHVDVGTSRRNVSSLSSSSPVPSAAAKQSEQPESTVPVVDEFSNSFSQRVITPARLRERPPSIKQLKASSIQRLAALPSTSERPAAKSDYGKVTIISSATSRRQPGAPARQIPDVRLPSYALSLLDGLTSTPSPPLNLREPETSFLTFRQPVALAPLIELPSFTASMSQDSLQSTMVSPTPTVFAPPTIASVEDRKPSLKKQRSLFTLRLPKRRPSIPHLSHTTSHITLAAASSTTTVSDTSGDVPNNGFRSKDGSKGLPSTRLYDLSQLGPAPDDLPHVSIGLTARQKKPPATPKRKGLQAPFSALRDVKNRLANFGRR